MFPNRTSGYFHELIPIPGDFATTTPRFLDIVKDGTSRVKLTGSIGVILGFKLLITPLIYALAVPVGKKKHFFLSQISLFERIQSVLFFIEVLDIFDFDRLVVIFREIINRVFSARNSD